jgi:hypothetical protein
MGASSQKHGGLIEMSSRHGDNHAVDDAGGKQSVDSPLQNGLAG